MATIIDRQTEAQLQASIVQQLRWVLPEDAEYFAVPNGGERHDAVGRQLAGQGVRAGIPDLCVVYDSRAIFLEIKTLAGKVSPSQKQAHTKLRGCGCPVYVCRSPEEVRDALEAAGVPLRHSMARP